MFITVNYYSIALLTVKVYYVDKIIVMIYVYIIFWET